MSYRLKVYKDGRVCISILHPPGDDPNMYEKSSERWSPGMESSCNYATLSLPIHTICRNHPFLWSHQSLLLIVTSAISGKDSTVGDEHVGGTK